MNDFEDLRRSVCDTLKPEVEVEHEGLSEQGTRLWSVTAPDDYGSASAEGRRNARLLLSHMWDTGNTPLLARVIDDIPKSDIRTAAALGFFSTIAIAAAGLSAPVPDVPSNPSRSTRRKRSAG